MTTKSEIERVLWNACDSFRGKIDSSRYKDYILSMLFVKYLSDVSEEKREQYREQYDGDERRVERAMSRERFKLDATSTFGYLYKNRHDSEIGLKTTRHWLLLKIITTASFGTCFAPSISTPMWTLVQTSRQKMRPSATCWKTSTDLTCVLLRWTVLTLSVTPTNI